MCPASSVPAEGTPVGQVSHCELVVRRTAGSQKKKKNKKEMTGTNEIF